MAVTDLGVAGMAALLGIWLVQGNGYWGGGSWGNSRPRYASADQFTDNYNTRSSSSRTRTSGGYDRNSVAEILEDMTVPA
jgi:hypothetical protein